MRACKSRRAELRAKQSEISPVISVACSGTRSRNLFRPEAMSWAVSAEGMREDMATQKEAAPLSNDGWRKIAKKKRRDITEVYCTPYIRTMIDG